jgi:glycine C-acetyltransferase
VFDPAHLGLTAELDQIRDAGTFKVERILEGPQNARISVNGLEVLNFCANNYLGLADDARLVAAAKEALDAWGFGLASVRFICGTQGQHKELERELSSFHGMDDTILYSSCFDANAGLFETLCGPEDAIVSDALNHASIIDGIRLSKAHRFRYEHLDLADLERQLEAAKATNARRILVATDGVFSMDGDIAPLAAICDVAERFGAMVMVDESHATGFLGPTGRGSVEHCAVQGRVDVVTSTLGKALGGASGGFTTGRAEIVELLRQRSRPYLFSNTLAPSIVGATRAVLRLLDAEPERRARVQANALTFRRRMTEAGFQVRPGVHPIVPIHLGDAPLAVEFARRMLDHGIYVIGFSFPVVPRGQARIRVQLSAAHTPEHVDRAIEAFVAVGRSLGVVS